MAGRPRSFVCPDDLWAACERAAWQSGRPVDDVVTEALRRFMQGAQTAGPPPPPAPPPPGPPPFPPTLVAGHAPAPFPGPPPMRPPSAAPPPPPMHAPPPPPMPHYGATPMPPPGYGPPPMPPPVQPSTVTPPAPGGYGRPYGAQAAPPPFPSPPAPPGGPQSVADGPPAYPIFLYCEGERAQIMQPRFIIGRSRNASDFAINDSNVSRQHAAVEWLRGHYHIVDMGSTNGIQFQGRRIERKVIYDGDVIILAGHTLRFARQ